MLASGLSIVYFIYEEIPILSCLLIEMDAVAAMVEKIVAENKDAVMDQEEY